MIFMNIIIILLSTWYVFKIRTGLSSTQIFFRCSLSVLISQYIHSFIQTNVESPMGWSIESPDDKSFANTEADEDIALLEGFVEHQQSYYKYSLVELH